MSVHLQDAESKKSIENLRTTNEAVYGSPESSEVIPVSVCRVVRLQDPSSPLYWRPVPSDEGTLKVAVSQVSLPPLDGVYTISFDAETTADIAFDATAEEVEDALNALAGVVSWGGVTVRDTDEEGGLFSIRFNDPGAPPAFTADTDNLAPENVHGAFGVSLPGSEDVSEVRVFRLVQNPATFCICDEESETPAASVEVVQVGVVDGVNHKVRVRLFALQDQEDTRPLPVPYDGRWSITVDGEESALMAHDASAEDVVTAMEAMTAVGADNVSVFLESEGVYLIGFQGDHAGEDMGTITADGSALLVIPYMTGALDFRTAGISLLLGDADSVEAVQVIEWTPPGGTPQVIGRKEITINRAIIEPDSVTPTANDPGQTAAQVAAMIATALGAYQSGSVALSASDTAVVVAFDEDLSSTDYTPYFALRNAGVGSDAVGTLDVYGKTVSGFTVRLTGPVSAGAYLDYIAVERGQLPPTLQLATEEEMEAGTENEARGMSPALVKAAINTLAVRASLYADDLTTVVISGQDRQLLDSGAFASADWEARFLKSDDDTFALKWNARQLFVAGGSRVLDFSGTNPDAAPYWFDDANGKRLTGSGRGLAWTTVPATAGAAGDTGQVSFDGSYIYRCTAANTWERAALTFATW